ncbi:hypothetical protein PYW08_013973 [Mythimna loreyi]|uniref:Uncharacterized protein n=1 Tax=Mythimna loreyi TaxID=667449 RepID=A0ACC2R7D9_9NEOP|nr:hypothetical protein PYW08_013973 [Mythimna loreyi]
MIVFLIINMFMVVNCLDPKTNNDINDEIKTIMGKYLRNIPDVEPRYVLNDKIASVISHYFKGKITALPLYKISLKIDRNPVKIPWSLAPVDETQGDVVLQRSQMIQEPVSVENVGAYRVVKTGHRQNEVPDTEEPSKPAKTSQKAITTTTEPTLIEIQ